MNTDDQLHESVNRLADVATETAHRASEAAQRTYQTVRTKADQAVVKSQSLIRERPVTVILSTLALGFIAGYAMSHREQMTFRRRYIDNPLHEAQDALHNFLTPVMEKIQDHYANARGGVDHALDKLQQEKAHAARSIDSWLGQARRVGNNLKFW